MKRLRRAVLALGVLITLCVPVGTRATANESIKNFEAQIKLQTDASATITETITYDFSTSERHGIFRYIPLRYTVNNSEYRGYQLGASVDSVKVDGEIVNYQEDTSDPNFLQLKIGDANISLTGIHIYTITYQMSPVIIHADDGNAIFRFNTPGTGWDVPTEKTSISIHGPDGYTASTCYQGAQGETAQECSVDTQKLMFKASRNLTVGETITAEVTYPFTTFTTVAEQVDFPKPNTPLFAWILIGVLLCIPPLLAFFGFKSLFGYLAYIRRRKQELVIPQYEPPTGMRPAELGLLLDNSSSGAEFSATLINFAVQGYMKIIEKEPKKWYKNAVFEFEKIKDPDTKTADYERTLFAEIFDGSNKVSTSEIIKRNRSFALSVASFQSALKKKLESYGFYSPVNLFRRSLSSRMTEDGYKRWAEVEGFRDFLKVTEADRMHMLEAPKLKPEQFSAFLPYAVALGVEKQWAQQFQSLQVDTSSWYVSSDPTFNVSSVYALSSLNSSLRGVSTSVSSSSGSSGSGGGFSGGGFGGGGGGSW